MKNFWLILKDAGSGFRRHKGIKLSASLCFYILCSPGYYASLMVVSRLRALFTAGGDLIGKDAAFQKKFFLIGLNM